MNIDGVCGVAVSARLAVNQKVAVRLRSDTLGRRLNERLKARGKSEATPVCSPALTSNL
jgi:hypothetical protein